MLPQLRAMLRVSGQRTLVLQASRHPPGLRFGWEGTGSGDILPSLGDEGVGCELLREREECTHPPDHQELTHTQEAQQRPLTSNQNCKDNGIRDPSRDQVGTTDVGVSMKGQH